jgi:hypothetical protein
MRRRRAQSGDSKFGCILWLLLLGVAVLISWKAVPVKIATAEFYDYMVEQAKFAGGTHPDTLKKRLLVRATELELPVNEKNLSVERIGDRIRIKCSYVVPLEFPGYTYVWKFDNEVDRPIFIF